MLICFEGFCFAEKARKSSEAESFKQINIKYPTHFKMAM
jgi:hypothetical protein